MSLVTSGHVVNGSSGGTSTITLNTTGADFLVAVVAAVRSIYFPSLSDNYGNTWTKLIGEQAGTNETYAGLYYVQNPTVGSDHVITLGSDAYNTVDVLAFSGMATASVADQNNYATAGETTSVPTGSITPSENGCLIIAGLGSSIAGNTAPTINDSFTVDYAASSNSSNYADIGAAYLVQATAAAIDPTWTLASAGGSTASVGFIASFLPGSSAPPRRPVGTFPLIGLGMGATAGLGWIIRRRNLLRRSRHGY